MTHIDITKIFYINALRHSHTLNNIEDSSNTGIILCDIFNNTHIKIDTYDIYNKKQLCRLLLYMRTLVSNSDGVIIHIECHGTSKLFTNTNVPIFPCIEINGVDIMPMHYLLKLIKRINKRRFPTLTWL